MFLAWAVIAIIAGFQAYPSLGDHALHLALLPMFLSFLALAGHRVIIVLYVYVFLVCFGALAWFSWIERNTGNANFFYATNLVLALALIWLVTEALGMMREQDYRRKRKLAPFAPPHAAAAAADTATDATARPKTK